MAMVSFKDDPNLDVLQNIEFAPSSHEATGYESAVTVSRSSPDLVKGIPRP
jgi:hypothetical protein